MSVKMLGTIAFIALIVLGIELFVILARLPFY